MLRRRIIKRIKLTLQLVAALIAIATGAFGSDSALDQLLRSPEFKGEIPFPFADFMAQTEEVLGADPFVRTKGYSHAVIPFGRSLHRYSADPEYLSSPRLVVAATGKGDYANRLFFGFQPLSEEIEVISFNEKEGHFVFQRIVDYVDGASPSVVAADEAICTSCHQNHAPIFSRPLWGETNANPEISKLLAPLGEEFEGLSVAQNLDAVNAVDLAVNNANSLLAARQLWNQVCASASACKSLFELAVKSLVFKSPQLSSGIRINLDEIPRSVSNTDFRLPNFDPLSAMADGFTGSQVIDRADELAAAVEPRDEVIYFERPADVQAAMRLLLRETQAVFRPSDRQDLLADLELCPAELSTERLAYSELMPGVFECDARTCLGRSRGDKLTLKRLSLNGSKIAHVDFLADQDGGYRSAEPTYLSAKQALVSIKLNPRELELKFVDHGSLLDGALAQPRAPDWYRQNPHALIKAFGKDIRKYCEGIGNSG